MKYQKKSLQNFQPHWKIAWSVLSGCFFFHGWSSLPSLQPVSPCFFWHFRPRFAVPQNHRHRSWEFWIASCGQGPSNTDRMWRKKTCLKHWDRLFFWLVDSEFSNVEAYLLSTRFVLTEAVLQPTVFYTNEDAEAGCVCGIHWHDLWF